MTNKHIDRTRILILAGIALLTGSHRHCRASSPDKTHLDFDDLPKNRDRHFHSPPMIRGKRKLEVGPLTATYDPEFTALRCHNISTECDTVFQIAGVGESETNAPNTIDSCEDYSIGTHRKDESIERMRVRSLDDGPLAVGKEVIVEAIVYRAVNTTGRDYPNADTLGHFFYTPNAHSRHWSYVNTTIVQVENTATVSQFVLSATFVLQPGNGTQAVRLSYGYGEYAIHNCHRIGSYYDVDDLVFEVDHDLIRYPGFTYFATAYGLPSTPPVWNTANYSSDFRVPRCQEYGTRCDTGSSLIAGSGDFESNSPNSFTTCADAPTGTGQRYESIDRIRVFSMNGEYMTSGSWAQIFANVHIPTEINRTTADDYYHIAHFYHLSFVSGHNHWNYITSRFAKPDVETAYFTANFILPVGEHQMIRVIYGYGPATVGPCVKSWEYYDVDDLIFRVVQPLTSNPTRLPTSLPTSHPTASPTNSPTLPPTLPKTFSPTLSPTLSPSNGPSNLPSAQPSLSPSNPKTWAAFDSHYNSPRCVDVVASCDTGDDLIAGVAEQEPNASNTIDGCEDFSSPSTHQVESIQRISIETVDGGEFAVGKEVEVKAFVRAASNTEGREYPGKKDVASFFYAANADTKDWYFITAATFQTDGEIHTIVAKFMLQPGQSTQAIRLNFGYAEFMIHSCKRSSSFYDVDDLVFDVNHDMFPEPTFHYIPAVEEPYPPAETIRRFAIYDDDYTAPRCLELGSSCETGSTLVKKSSEYEQNTPNSVDECRDVSVSSEEVFESIEMVMVRSLNGGIMSVGSWVELFVMVKTPNRPRSPNRHHLAHFYYKTNVDPYWKYISSMFVLMEFENSSFLTKFKLPEGETHTIRVIYGYGELEIGPCVSGWEYMDVDDLVFSVAPAPPTPTSTPTLRPSASSLTFYDSSPPSKSPTSMMTTPLESPAPTPSPTILFRTTSPGISGSNSQRNFAEYDDLLKAPRCPLGSLCDSDVLLLGMNVDGIDGPEPNAPNTIDSCQQGESTMDLVTGTPVFRRDESVDRIVIRSVDGDTMKAGREVEAEITLYGAEDTSSRSNPDSRSIAHVYYTPNAGASGEIEWKYLWSESVDPGVGEHVFQVRFFLLSGKDIEATTSTQAVRVNYAYAQYNADSCFDDDFLDHPYVDVDDLAFEVQEYDATDDSEIDPSPTLAPTSTSSVDCNRTGTFIYFIVTVSIFAVVNEVLVA